MGNCGLRIMIRDPRNFYKVSLFTSSRHGCEKIGWEAPAELLAMADEQVASKADRAHSGKRTGAATATREARKADRSRDLKRFIEDVYEALENAGHEVGENGSRKPLPVLERATSTRCFLCATLTTRLRSPHSTMI